MIGATDEAIRKAQRRKVIVSVIVGSVALHVIAGVIATIWIVARYFAPAPAAFEVRKDIRIPPKEREHKMNMAEFDALTPKPAFQEKLASLRPTDFSLPDLPSVPFDQMLPLDPTEMVSDQVSSMVGASGLGAAGQGAGGLGGSGDGFSFFGIQSDARRVLLIFDISQSVLTKSEKAGVPMSTIKTETRKLIEGLGINVRFNLIQMAQNYQLLQAELVPATDGNKAAAKEWIDKEWVTTGSMPRKKSVVSNPRGLAGVLERAYEMEPDTIFVVSDGNFYWRPEGGIVAIPHREIRRVIDDAEKTLGRPVPIHLIGFEIKTEDRNAWRRITRSTGGSLRELN